MDANPGLLLTITGVVHTFLIVKLWSARMNEKKRNQQEQQDKYSASLIDPFCMLVQKTLNLAQPAVMYKVKSLAILQAFLRSLQEDQVG